MISFKLNKWWEKWFKPKHRTRHFCYFCHIELTKDDESVKGLVTKPGKPAREVLAHADCVFEDSLFTKLSEGENDGS